MKKSIFKQSLSTFILLPLVFLVLTVQGKKDAVDSIVIENMGNHVIKYGATFEFSPKIIGNVNLCRKDLGHDDVLVHPQSGKITWDTSQLAFGRGFYIRIKCSNYESSSYASMVVHVDKSGKSKIVVAGKKGVSKYIGIAGVKMRSGDTLIIPDGLYPVSVDGDGSYENAFKRSAPPNGTDKQFTTVIAESPGGVTVSGTANKDIGKQKNAFQLSPSENVAIVGFVLKDVQRESFTTTGPGEHLIIDFVGAQGAGTWGLPCSNAKEAKKGQCSNAGMRVNGGTPLFQNSYDWGHNRYGIMTRSSSGSVTRRSLVRLDEHRGSQPYGGFSNYCDSAHLSQDNIVFDSLAIAAPHYKNYAGLDAYPATGCVKRNSEIIVSGLLAVNNKLSLSLLDSKAGPAHQWRNLVSYDSEGTCTPQKNRCGAWLLQSKKPLVLKDSFLGKARGFKGSSSLRRAFAKKSISYDQSVIISDIPMLIDQGAKPEYLPESQLYYNGKSDTFFGDKDFDTLTKTRRWPIAGEDIIAKNMQNYSNLKALKVGGGTVEIIGNRGAVLKNESMSEYFWKYIKKEIPPLVVRVNKDPKSEANHYRIAWEHFTGSTRNEVKGWQVNCVTENPFKLDLIKALPETQLSYSYSGKCEKFAVQAVYSTGVSGITYIEASID
ncbi:MAG: hypothetical protein COA86_09740 [Kangiella sp.]|nr:MAG: hypothetical protein COA86_09740 [Kangiella sp.]